MTNMSKPILYLMLGYPGAGKTTAAKLIHEQTGAVHLWADHIRKELFGKRPEYSHAENLALYDHLNHMTAELLASGNSVIFDTSFNYFKDREHLRQIATTHHAQAVIVWVKTPKLIAHKRATSDAHKQPTRALGNITENLFERWVSQLEMPNDDESYITLDGTLLTPQLIKDKLTSLNRD